jgi:antitoxin PrlF
MGRGSGSAGSLAPPFMLMNNDKPESIKIGWRRFISETALQKFIAASTTSAAPARDRVRSIEARQIPLKIAIRASPTVAEGVVQMSSQVRLTSKGQTTIPKEIREGLHMKTGDRMTFTLLPDGTVLMRVKNKSVAARLFKKSRRARPVKDLSR